MNTKFTKGPWVLDCGMVVIGDIYYELDNAYDAPLIACSPDMYEMLESKLDLIRCGIGANYSGDPKENPKYLEVVELLKRARGE